MTQHSELIDTIDLLSEARNLNEAAFMASESMSDMVQCNAMTCLIGTIGDRLTDVADGLNATLAELAALKEKNGPGK